MSNFADVLRASRVDNSDLSETWYAYARAAMLKASYKHTCWSEHVPDDVSLTQLSELAHADGLYVDYRYGRVIFLQW